MSNSTDYIQEVLNLLTKEKEIEYEDAETLIFSYWGDIVDNYLKGISSRVCVTWLYKKWTFELY
jgi:hypothetical protein